MPAEEFHEKEIWISDDWCDESIHVGNMFIGYTIHICDKKPLHGGSHTCSHGDACGYSWRTKILHRRVFKYSYRGCGSESLTASCTCGGYSHSVVSRGFYTREIAAIYLGRSFQEHLRGRL